MTIFDKILRKEIPAQIVYEDEHVLAFRDINPQAPVHVLVIPKTRIPRFENLADEQDYAAVGKLFVTASKIARDLGLNAEGYRVVINNGRNGQQTVEHIHLHLLGGRQMTWPPG